MTVPVAAVTVGPVHKMSETSKAEAVKLKEAGNSAFKGKL